MILSGSWTCSLRSRCMAVAARPLLPLLIPASTMMWGQNVAAELGGYIPRLSCWLLALGPLLML
jgi:hypothetical protein